ncbi:glycosyltransferase family 2 protein [Microbispora sp. H11081]|uniref:glycosyltransferase family 2 protein n=1 Tax=Microbispora sp. H11081 TaxID=2729107 RepID=UPI0028965388|nr:glycosyltransferase family 2 protein [Microbispora sp. H11081]
MTVTTDMCSPYGFTRRPTEETGTLSWSGGRWTVGDRPLAAPLQDGDVAPLRPLRGLRVEWPAEPAAGAFGTVAGLAAAGVPLTCEDPPGWVREADPVLARLTAAWTPEDDDRRPESVVDLRREEHSVRLRRHALRAAGVGTGLAPVTVVMATRRPHYVGDALRQLARQRGVDIEVVVALHGFPAERVRQAVEEFPRPVTVIEAEPGAPLGTVLNQAAARASTGIVAKWDDDDWYGPEHLADLLLAMAYSGAELVGTAPEFFYLQPLHATIRRLDYGSEMWADHVAGGTILVGRDLFEEVGGFGPVSRGEDAHLLRAVEAAGGRIYRTHGLGYVLRRSLSADHTWNLPLAHFLRVATNQWRGFRPSVMLESP